MARKSRKNLPVSMSVSESSLAMDAVPETADNVMLQTPVDLESIATVYHAAIYARLSYETEANRERDTVDTQIAYLKNFIDRQEDMELADIYADVSFSGTNF